MDAVIWNDNSMKVKALPREIYDAVNHKYALEAALKGRNMHPSKMPLHRKRT